MNTVLTRGRDALFSNFQRLDDLGRDCEIKYERGIQGAFKKLTFSDKSDDELLLAAASAKSALWDLRRAESADLDLIGQRFNRFQELFSVHREVAVSLGDEFRDEVIRVADALLEIYKSVDKRTFSGGQSRHEAISSIADGLRSNHPCAKPFRFTVSTLQIATTWLSQLSDSDSIVINPRASEEAVARAFERLPADMPERIVHLQMALDGLFRRFDEAMSLRPSPPDEISLPHREAELSPLAVPES